MKAEPATLSPPWPIAVDRVIVALFWFVGASSLLFSGAMGDSNRDFYAALQILQGEQLPVAGPAIAHSFHYSALWFYVLAFFAMVSQSWAGVAILSGVLISGVYPLMYALGKALGGRSLGLLATAMVAIPGWASVYLLVYSHPALIPAGAVLAALVVHWWWRQPGSLFRAAVGGFALSLAVHAHIINLGLLLPFAVLLLMAPVAWARKSLACSAAGVGFSVLFLPYLVAEALGGFAELRAGAQYASHTDILANLIAIPRVLWNGLVGGVPFAMENVLRVGTVALGLACGLIAAIVVLSAVGWFRLRVIPGWVWVTLLALAGQVVTGVLLRNYTPFYQILGIVPFVALLCAYGLVQIWPRFTVPGVVAIAALFLMLQWSSQRLVAHDGVFTLDVLHVANLRARGGPHNVVRWAFPAWARDQYARHLCDQGEVALYGHLAAAIELSNALEVSLHCPEQVSSLHLGAENGAARPGQRIGAIHRSMGRALGLQEAIIGNLVSVSIAHPFGDQGMPVSDAAEYPPRDIATGPAVRRDYPISVPPDEALVIVNVRNVWNPGATWTVECDGVGVAPVFNDGDSAAYRFAGGCAEGMVFVLASEPGWIQLFTVAGSE